MCLKIGRCCHAEWDQHKLMSFAELVEHRTNCNVGQNESGEFGEWFFVPDSVLPSGHRVIYYGYFGDHLPREDTPHIFAALFDANDPDELAEYTFRVHEWQSQPARDPHT